MKEPVAAAVAAMPRNAADHRGCCPFVDQHHVGAVEHDAHVETVAVVGRARSCGSKCAKSADGARLCAAFWLARLQPCRGLHMATARPCASSVNRPGFELCPKVGPSGFRRSGGTSQSVLDRTESQQPKLAALAPASGRHHPRPLRVPQCCRALEMENARPSGAEEAAPAPCSLAVEQQNERHAGCTPTQRLARDENVGVDRLVQARQEGRVGAEDADQGDRRRAPAPRLPPDARSVAPRGPHRQRQTDLSALQGAGAVTTPEAVTAP